MTQAHEGDTAALRIGGLDAKQLEQAQEAIANFGRDLRKDPTLWKVGAKLLDLTGLINSMLYDLRIESVDPCSYWEIIDGWVQFSPLPAGQSEVEVKFVFTNRSSSPVSARISGSVDDLPLLTEAGGGLIEELAPGAVYRGMLWFYGAAPGLHTLSVGVWGTDPTETIETYNPATGALDKGPVSKVLASVQQPYVAGSRDDIRKSVTQYLGITMSKRVADPGDDHLVEYFRADGVDQDGVGRHITVKTESVGGIAGAGGRWRDQVHVTLNYWEDGAPNNQLQAKVFVWHGNLYELLPKSLLFNPIIGFNIRAPLDGPRGPVVVGGARIPNRPPVFLTDDQGNTIFREVYGRSVTLTDTYDGIRVSGHFRNGPLAYIQGWEPWPHPLEGQYSEFVPVPEVLYSVDSEGPDPNYDLQRYFRQILRRVAFFSSVLEDRMPTLPPELASLRAAAGSWDSGLRTLSDPTATPEATPPRKGTPGWLRITFHSTIAFLVGVSCAERMAFPWGTAVCAVGTVSGVTASYFFEKLTKAQTELSQGRFIPAPPLPPPGIPPLPGAVDQPVGQVPDEALWMPIASGSDDTPGGPADDW